MDLYFYSLVKPPDLGSSGFDCRPRQDRGFLKKDGGFLLLVFVYCIFWGSQFWLDWTKQDFVFFHKKCARRGNDRICLSRCALPHYCFFTQTIVRAKASFRPLAAIPNFKKGVNWFASFVNIVSTTVMLKPVFSSFHGTSLFFKNSWRTNLHVSDRPYHDEWLEHHI